MTATQSFKIYEILHRHFKNDADAKVVVQEIETIIDNNAQKWAYTEGSPFSRKILKTNQFR